MLRAIKSLWISSVDHRWHHECAALTPLWSSQTANLLNMQTSKPTWAATEGPLLCALCTVMWCLSCLSDLNATLRLSSAALRLMGDSTDVATSPDQSYEIRSLSRSRGAGFLIGMLTKAAVASMLLISGTIQL